MLVAFTVYVGGRCALLGGVVFFVVEYDFRGAAPPSMTRNTPVLSRTPRAVGGKLLVDDGWVAKHTRTGKSLNTWVAWGKQQLP